MRTYIICGYGIPKNIESDENYRTYLNVAFNHIFAESAEQDAVIIPCGGATSLEPPFKGTEAEMMGSYIEQMMRRDFLLEQTAQWTIRLEDRSISSLENLVFARQMIDGAEGVTVFCDVTRRDRNAKIASRIFNGDVTIDGIDFDVSKNRYIDSETLRKKEGVATAEALWTLEDQERLQRHHDFFERKLGFLREKIASGVSPIDAVNAWLTNAPDIARQLMPDHSLYQ